MPRGITAIVEEQTKEEETHTKAKATACSRGGGAVATTGAVRATCDYLRASSRDDLHTSRTTRHLCTSRTTRTVRQRWLCCLRPSYIWRPSHKDVVAFSAQGVTF